MAANDSTDGIRLCISCATEKPLSAFRDKRRKCKGCTQAQSIRTPEQKAQKAARQREARANETPEARERRLAGLRAYNERHREVELERRRKYYAENRERLRQAYRDRCASDPEFVEASRARAREYRANFPERKAEANKAWAKENKERMAEYFRASKAKRRRNPVYRLNASIGTQIRNAIGDRKGGRRWESIVGYTLDELLAHIQRQFMPGMTWENYGAEWHVDHIVAQAEFELCEANDATVRACWALTNLRPMWARANMSKGKRRTHLL
jgi:hypothetical protein